MTATAQAKKKEEIRQRREVWKHTVGNPSRRSCDILEYLDLSTVDAGTVDRDNAIIRHVKVLGRHSPNKHGMPGVEGTTYEPTAMNQAKELLESGRGNTVNMGHPPRGEPDAERKPGEPNGTLFNPRIENQELYADWQLIPSHPMTPQLLDCASNNKLHGQYALSINARGYGDIRNRRYCISEFQAPYIRSVDCVTRGGACRTLYESGEPMKKKFKEHLAEAPEAVQKRFANLLEMYEDIGDMPTDAPAAAPMEGETATEPGWEEHCAEMVKAIVNEIAAGTLTPEEGTKKIVHALKLLHEEEEKGEGEESEATDAEEGAETEQEEKDAMESRELEQLRNEKKCRDLCESMEFIPNSLQVEALAGMSTDAKRKKMVEEFKKVGKVPVKGSTTPRTGTVSNVQESKQNSSYEDRSPEARKRRAAALKG